MYQHATFASRIVRSDEINHPRIPEECTYRGSYRNWDCDSLARAMSAVEHGKSIRCAAEMYGIPRATLHDHVSGKIQYGAKSGPKTYLTAEEENELVVFLLRCAEIGYPHTKKELFAIVQQIIDNKGIKATITNGWWERFCQSNPQVTLRTAVPLSYARAMASDRVVIDKYYDTLEDTLRSNGIFDKPANCLNFDETGIPLSPNSPKVIDEVGSKNPSYLTGNSKSQITVLACTSAAGYAIPPFVIFDRKTLNPQYTRGEVPGTLYGLSQSGWIDKTLFSEWFFNHFLVYAPPIRPLLLLMDGHSSHYCPEVIRAAAAEKVILFVLPPNTTHLTQPLDKGCFGPLKTKWKEVCHKFITKNPGRQITRFDFSTLFAEAWYQAMTMSNIISSFRKTGVCPFNRNAVVLPCDTIKSMESLAQKTGLAYIPLYSPAPPHSAKDIPSFSCEKRQLSYSEPDVSIAEDSQFVLPLRSATTISKFLNKPLTPSKIPVKHPKSSGRVLTSRENLEELEERELQKKKAIEEKEKNKKARELKKKLKIEEAEKKKSAAANKKLKVQKSAAENKKLKVKKGKWIFQRPNKRVCLLL